MVAAADDVARHQDQWIRGICYMKQDVEPNYSLPIEAEDYQNEEVFVVITVNAVFSRL